MNDDTEPTAFDAEREHARSLLEGDDVTALYVGVIRDGETVDTTFAQIADSPEQEGLQALSLLATHLRAVANEAGVDPSVVARDAQTLAGQVDECSTEASAPADKTRHDESTDDIDEPR
ncbi:hypothetical protein ACNS7O_04105 [Haloferacaceae archaeon DSL9]